MITDFETDFIYFSELLKTKKEFISTCYSIAEILNFFEVKYGFLSDTNDIWTRDYMPIQISDNHFIEYRYDPDYLQAKKYRCLKTYSDLVCDSINLSTVKSDIILDGGNVVKSSNCVILTDKIIEENKAFYKPIELINKLKEILKVEKVVLIPWDKEEPFGHADGMLRFINDETVLIQGYYDTYPEAFRNQLFGSLEKNGIHWEKLTFDVEKEDTRNWAYMNFLQTKDLILLPKLGFDEDNQAKEQFGKYYPSYKERNRIRQVDVTEIVKGEGALNCISWTIKKTV